MATDLTGQKMLSTMRTKHGWAAFGYGIITGWFAFLLVFSIYFFSREEFLMGLMTLALGALLGWVFGKKFIESLKIALNPRKATVFRKYGDPEEIAERIFTGRETIILEQNQVVITGDYILHRKHYETFVPLADILLVYRKEHRTNGVPDSISLVVHDRYGDSYEYPFKMGKKFAGDMDFAVGEMIKRMPDCRIGYDQENLRYVKERKQPIPE